jgi:hypothetical protein
MAGLIRSQLSLIFPRILARVQSVLGPTPPTGFTVLNQPLDPSAIIVSQDPLGTEPPILEPEQMVVLSLEDFVGPAQGEHGGAMEQQLRQLIGVACWTRAEVDETHQHLLIMTSQPNPPANTNLPYNHLDLFEWTFASLQNFFVSDTAVPTPNFISSQALEWVGGKRPSVHKGNRFWLWSYHLFQVKWTPVAMPESSFYPAAYH